MVGDQTHGVVLQQGPSVGDEILRPDRSIRRSPAGFGIWRNDDRWPECATISDATVGIRVLVLQHP